MLGDGFKLPSLKILGKARINRRNIFAPLVTLIAICLISTTFGKTVGSSIWFFDALGGLTLILISIGAYTYLHLLFKDPDRLHTEKFQIEKSQLQQIQGPGLEDGFVLEHGPLTANTHAKTSEDAFPHNNA